jgi:hypothetical protein
MEVAMGLASAVEEMAGELVAFDATKSIRVEVGTAPLKGMPPGGLSVAVRAVLATVDSGGSPSKEVMDKRELTVPDSVLCGISNELKITREEPASSPDPEG